MSGVALVVPWWYFCGSRVAGRAGAERLVVLLVARGARGRRDARCPVVLDLGVTRGVAAGQVVGGLDRRDLALGLVVAGHALAGRDVHALVAARAGGPVAGVARGRGGDAAVVAAGALVQRDRLGGAVVVAVSGVGVARGAGRRGPRSGRRGRWCRPPRVMGVPAWFCHSAVAAASAQATSLAYVICGAGRMPVQGRSPVGASRRTDCSREQPAQEGRLMPPWHDRSRVRPSLWDAGGSFGERAVVALGAGGLRAAAASWCCRPVTVGARLAVAGGAQVRRGAVRRRPRRRRGPSPLAR